MIGMDLNTLRHFDEIEAYQKRIKELEALVREMGNVLHKVSIGYYQTIMRQSLIDGSKEVLSCPLVREIMEKSDE